MRGIPQERSEIRREGSLETFLKRGDLGMDLTEDPGLQRRCVRRYRLREALVASCVQVRVNSPKLRATRCPGVRALGRDACKPRLGVCAAGVRRARANDSAEGCGPTHVGERWA